MKLRTRPIFRWSSNGLASGSSEQPTIKIVVAMTMRRRDSSLQRAEDISFTEERLGKMIE